MRNTIIVFALVSSLSAEANTTFTTKQEPFLITNTVAGPDKTDDAEAKERIYEFYRRYIATFMDSDESPEEIKKEYLTPECIKQIDNVSKQSMADEIIRAQDSGEDALKSLEVKHMGDNRYIVTYTFNPGLEYETTTSIPLETTTVDGKTYISYIKPTYDYSVKEEDVVMHADVLPEFPGGITALMDFIRQNTRYPKYAWKNNIEGRVLVSFVVKKDGTVCNSRVTKSVNQCLDHEAERVIDILPKFTPATKDGKPVNMKYNLPITFKKKK